MIDLLYVPLKPEAREAPGSGGPAPSYKWLDVQVLLDVVVKANVLGPNANNISAAARTILFELNESLLPAPETSEKVI